MTTSRSLLILFSILLTIGCASSEKLISSKSGNDLWDRVAENDTYVRTHPVDITTISGNIVQDLKTLNTREFIKKYYQKVVLIQNVKVATVGKTSEGLLEIIGDKESSSTGFKFLLHPERSGSVNKIAVGKVVNIKGYVFSRSQGPYTLYGAQLVK